MKRQSQIAGRSPSFFALLALSACVPLLSACSLVGVHLPGGLGSSSSESQQQPTSGGGSHSDGADTDKPLASMRQDAQAWRDGWKKLEAQFNPKLQAAIKLPTFMERSEALRALWKEVNAAADAANLNRGVIGKDRSLSQPSYVGLNYEIIRSIIAIHRDGRRLFLLEDLFKREGIDLSRFKEGARPFLADDAERDLYVWAKNDYATLPDERRKEIFALRNAALEKAAPEVAFKAFSGVRPEALIQGTPSGDGPEPKLLCFTSVTGAERISFTVAKVNRKGTQADLTLEATKRKEFSYDCKEDRSKINHVSDSGAVFYDTTCKSGSLEQHMVVDAASVEIPESITVSKGDEVDLCGDVESRKESRPVNTAARVVDEKYFKVTPRDIEAIRKPTK